MTYQPKYLYKFKALLKLFFLASTKEEVTIGARANHLPMNQVKYCID